MQKFKTSRKNTKRCKEELGQKLKRQRSEQEKDVEGALEFQLQCD